MFGMMGIVDFLSDEKFTKARRDQQKEHREDLLKVPVDWTPDIKWQKELAIRASTWQPDLLFDVPVIDAVDPNRVAESDMVVSPKGEWCYFVKRLPRGGALWTAKGSQHGSVVFDGPVPIPALHTKSRWRNGWEPAPMMSITPMELLTLRPGTRLGRGSVVVAGLGLGHQLIEVSKRHQVKRLVLIEKSQDLVDFIMPKIETRLARKLDDIIVGDVFKELPKLTADVAIVDTFPGYGGNIDDKRKLERTSKNVGRIWVWGSQYVR